MKNYYQSLGVEPEAAFEDIKKAYRQYAKKFHPDKQNGDEFFGDRFKEIQEAYEVLSSESSREDYDESFYSYYYSRQDDEASKEDVESALREEYEEKLRNQEAQFRKREQKIKEEFETKSNQFKPRASTAERAKPNATQRPATESIAKKGVDTTFTIFWTANFLVLSILCITFMLPAFYLLAYYMISLIIIQQELRFRWMIFNAFIFWLAVPGLALLLS